ncbi:MAG: hypothetical protein WB588_03130 [Dehalococcoidia bacterium]
MAEEENNATSQASIRFSTAAIVFAFMSIESFINNMMSDFSSLPDPLFSVHEQGFLSERNVSFSISGTNIGKFELTNRKEYKRLEDKIVFLLRRFGGNVVIKNDSLWQRFDKTREIRDRLTHPRKDDEAPPTPVDARIALEVGKEIITLVSTKVWGKPVEF